MYTVHCSRCSKKMSVSDDYIKSRHVEKDTIHLVLTTKLRCPYCENVFKKINMPYEDSTVEKLGGWIIGRLAKAMPVGTTPFWGD